MATAADTTAGGPPPDRAERRGRVSPPALAAGLLVGAFAVLAVVFVFRGRLNADEGWYLYGGRLAWRGQLPYKDFAFTQMPLTAYVYGLLQTIEASVFLGRLTSVVFAVGAVALSTRVAWREAGRAAGVAVALLCVAFPVGVYNLTLVKTYALSAFLLAAVLACLTAAGRPALHWTLGTAAAFGLLLTRTTGLPITVLVVLFCVVRAPDRVTRRNVVWCTVAGVVATLALPLTAPGSARYNLFTFHNLLWHGADLGTKLDEIVTTRLEDWVRAYPAYLALVVGAVVAVCTSRRLRAYLRRQPGVAVVAIGIFGMLGAQLVGGEWAPVEYFTPVIPALLAVTVVMLVRALRPDDGWAAHRALAVGTVVVLAAVAISTLVHPGVGEYFTTPTDAGSVQEAGRVADVIRAHTRDGDLVLTMWAQPSGLESTRDQVDGVTMGVFSYEDLTRQQAQEYHFVNREMLRSMLRRQEPAAVVLTGVDQLVFGSRGTFSNVPADPDEITGELEGRYRLVDTARTYGVNEATWVRIYVRGNR
jgi:hypothetical protein